MDREDFLKLNIIEQVEYINSLTITGLKVIQVAKQLKIGDKSIRTKLRFNGYIFNRKQKIYILDGNNPTITKEEKTSNNPTIIKEIPNKNANHNKVIIKEEKIFTDDEIKGIRELLSVKEQLLHNAITPSNNDGIINMDKGNRKKSTFNIDIDLLDKLESYTKTLINISKSDIVNQAIIEYLNRNKKE